MTDPKPDNTHAHYEAQLAEKDAEIERLRELCKQFNREHRSTFEQSCKNMERVKELEAEVARLRIWKDIADRRAKIIAKMHAVLIQKKVNFDFHDLEREYE